MKAFLLGDKRNPESKENINLIKTTLEKDGVKVDSSVFENTIDEDSKHLDHIYTDRTKSIKYCDFVVAESTYYSSGNGFLISYALSEKKPVLVLSKPGKISSIILKSVKNKLLTYKEYTPETIHKHLASYLSQVRKVIDTKFILIISPEIDRYLQWASENRRMHKAQVVRLALEDVMEKDKEYKASLKINK